MLDMNISLGRSVATTHQILQVIRPQLRLMRAIYRGVIEACRDGWLDANEDLELNDGGDQHVDEIVFEAIRTDALSSVRDWARDVGLVFDGNATQEFIRQALISAMVTRGGIDDLPAGALDY